MKKLTALLAVLLMCSLLPTMPAMAIGYDDIFESEDTTYCYWTGSGISWITGAANAPVSLYKRGEENATSISGYFPGTIVERLADEQNGFIKVRIGGSTGYLRANAVTDAAPCDPPLALLASSVQDIEIFSGVAANAKVIGAYPGGTMLTLLGMRSDGWCHVLVNGQIGFVKSNRLNPSPVFGEAYAGVTQNDVGETVAAAAADEAIICCPNSNDMLNLRKRADITAPSIGKYYNGTVVRLLEAPKDGWVKVSIADQAEGYVQVDYLAMQGQNVTLCHRQMVIDNKSGSGLNVRAKPNTDGEKLAEYKNGQEVTVIGQWYNDWYHIIVDGQYGFVLDRLSEIE